MPREAYKRPGRFMAQDAQGGIRDSLARRGARGGGEVTGRSGPKRSLPNNTIRLTEHGCCPCFLF